MGADSLFYSSFNVTPEETEGRLIQELGTGQWGSPALGQLLQHVVSEDRSFTDHEVEHEFPNGVGRKYMILHGGRTSTTGHPSSLVTLAFDDNTARRNAIEVLRHTEVRYRSSY